jgi:glycosyltransferase involved in cell wall biosynthesis
VPPVLFVHHRPHPGGAIRSLALLASALDSRWELHALVPEGPSANILREVGVTVHPAPVPAFTHTWDVQYRGLRWAVLGRELASLPMHLSRLRQVLREVRPALAHLNDGVMLATGAAVARAGNPVIWHLRSSLAHGGLDQTSRLICSRLDRYGAAAIAIDEDVAATFRLHIPMDVIPNPVEAADGPQATLSVPPGRVTIGYFGYLRRQKGWPQLLEAMRILIDQGFSPHGVFVGGAIRPPSAFEGPRGMVLKAVGVQDEERDFRLAVARLGLSEFVTLFPFVEDPLPYIRAVDIVAFPNQGVGLGRPILEAAALGKPVVAGGSAKGSGTVVDGESGRLLPHPTPTALADALGPLLSSPDLRASYGVAGARVAVRHSPPVVARAVEALYDSVIASDPAARLVLR